MAFKALVPLVILAAYGPALLRAQELFTCDRYLGPNWDDCKAHQYLNMG